MEYPMNPKVMEMWEKQITQLNTDLFKLQQIELFGHFYPLGFALGTGSNWEKAFETLIKDEKPEKIDKEDIAKENALIQGTNSAVKARNRCCGEIRPKYKEDGGLPKEFDKPKKLAEFKSMDNHVIDKILNDYNLCVGVEDGQTLQRAYSMQGASLLGEDSPSRGGFGQHPLQRRIPSFLAQGGLWGLPQSNPDAYIKDQKLRRLFGYLGVDTEEISCSGGGSPFPGFTNGLSGLPPYPVSMPSSSRFGGVGRSFC